MKAIAKKLRILFGIFLLLAITAVMPVQTQAQSTNALSFEERENEYSTPSKTITLYRTYANPSEVILELKDNYADFFESARRDGLPDLSLENANNYLSYSIANSSDDKLIYAFDILENDSQNEEIIALANEAEVSRTASQTSDSAIDLLCPINPHETSLPLEASLRAPAINLSAAQSYAARYATSHNTKYGYFNGADCTNFTSQILYAGGIPMDVHSSENSGWWWKSPSNRSISWIRAKTFAKYMGSGFNSKTWATLRATLYPGDFIGFDKADDGDVDHNAFVYDRANNLVRIAQHTNDYLKWEDATGWPSMQDGKCRFYRIRR